MSQITAFFPIHAHELRARTYQGIACSGFTVFAQLWCTEKKGPVFVTMFNPVSTIMVAILAYFIFGENLYVGRYAVHACGACSLLLNQIGAPLFRHGNLDTT